MLNRNKDNYNLSVSPLVIPTSIKHNLTRIHKKVANHRQLLSSRIEILNELINRMSSGITLSQSQEMAVRYADKITECQKRLNELKVYSTTLHD